MIEERLMEKLSSATIRVAQTRTTTSTTKAAIKSNQTYR